ncbi:hypothetical protein F5H01DRAFT_342288 [Linnemannia elongata]|nr:hypothetical protein F5H01DRAFT_342288 [Linnemannia elongata]
MTGNRVLKIPELVSLIGQHLDQHDFTHCIRVCREWFDIFTPLFYHTISVYDFDLYSHKFKGETNRAKRSAKNNYLASSDDDPGYGGRMVHKYAHLIHSITSSNIHALTCLGDQAVNLTHVGIRTRTPNATIFRPPCADNNEWMAWFWYREPFRDDELVVATLVALIDRNPGLKSVRIDLDNCDSGTERIIHALAKREHLEEVYLESIIETNIIEMTLDHCPHILSLCATFGLGANYVPGSNEQVFDVNSTCRVGAPTKIRHLHIRTTQAWLPHVLRRCPDLQTLMLYPLDANVFTILAQEVINLSLSKFFGLRSLEFTLPSLTTETNTALPTTLINSCSASLTALAITDNSRHDFFVPQIDPLLWSRLQEFRYTGWNAYRHNNTFVSQVCSVLALCPNLRVFKVLKAMVTANELLSTQVVCGQTLVSLTLTVCSDRISQTLQPPPWLQPVVPFTTQEIHMATMAQFELPIPTPLPHLQPLPPPPPQPAQVPQWPQYAPVTPHPPAGQAESELATMAQFELPSLIPHAEPQPPQQLPAPELPVFIQPFSQPPHNSINNNSNPSHVLMPTDLSAEEINADPIRVCHHIISEFPHLKRLEFRSEVRKNEHLGDSWSSPPIKENLEYVRLFREGLPRLHTLVVQGIREK